MSKNNKNLNKGMGPYDYGNQENVFVEAPTANSMMDFEIPLHSSDVDFNHDNGEPQMHMDYSTAFINSIPQVTTFMKTIFNPNCPISELSELADCINSSDKPLNEAEDILTPLFQSKAKELCPSDNMLAALTMTDVIHLIAGDLDCDGDGNCDDCDCCNDGCGDGGCDKCDCCNDGGCDDGCNGNCNNCNDGNSHDGDCCHGSCYICDCCRGFNGDCDDCICTKDDSDDDGILDPDAPLDVTVPIVCSCLFGEYGTYEQLPDEMKKAVDLTREAYAILVGESLGKLHSLLLHHFNDLPTTFVPELFSEISDRALYVLTFLDIIDPDHRTDNLPEDSDDCTKDVSEVAASEE